MCCVHVSQTHPVADPSFDAALCVTQLVFLIVLPSLCRASLWNAMRSHGCCTCSSAHSCTPDVSAVSAWETTEPLWCVFVRYGGGSRVTCCGWWICPHVSWIGPGCFLLWWTCSALFCSKITGPPVIYTFSFFICICLSSLFLFQPRCNIVYYSWCQPSTKVVLPFVHTTIRSSP